MVTFYCEHECEHTFKSHKAKSGVASANTGKEIILKRTVIFVMAWNFEGLETGGR